MAVGIMVGGAFGKIVSSLVSNVVMPPLGIITSGVDFKNLKVVLKKTTVDTAGNTLPQVTIDYGTFINAIVDFVIVAFAIFLVIKAMNFARKKEEAAPPPSKEEQLLTEIRDALKSRA
jgi:large conductance mechanosensitive channel